MPNRDIWLLAGTILAEHGDRSTLYLVEQLTKVRGDSVAVQNWRRIAAAVDFIAGAEPSS
jgi:hypothetical protein